MIYLIKNISSISFIHSVAPVLNLGIRYEIIDLQSTKWLPNRNYRIILFGRTGYGTVRTVASPLRYRQVLTVP